MSLLAWIIVGLIAGLIASRIVGDTGQGVIVDIALGIAGTFAGVGLFHVFGMGGAGVVSLDGVLVAVGGAVVSLVAFHSFSSGIR